MDVLVFFQEGDGLKILPVTFGAFLFSFFFFTSQIAEWMKVLTMLD